MTLGKVIGDVVSTMKHQDYDGYKILVIQPVDHQGEPVGKSFLALDAVQAGIGDTVLVIDEGGSGRAVLEAPENRTVRTVVSGIVDEVSTE
ncbi:MAG: EutN/CcmL family microcompartment protein [bacterium]|nr:EutN/CcmL family microcompartment protein [bacterium]